MAAWQQQFIDVAVEEYLNRARLKEQPSGQRDQAGIWRPDAIEHQSFCCPVVVLNNKDSLLNHCRSVQHIAYKHQLRPATLAWHIKHKTVGFSVITAANPPSQQEQSQKINTILEAWRVYWATLLVSSPGPSTARLTSLNKEFGLVEPGVAKAAECKVEPRWTHGYRHYIPHRAPEETCGCGYWSIKTLKDLITTSDIKAHISHERHMPTGKHLVFAKVALWGEIWEAELGYRSEYMYPQRLYVFSSDLTVLNKLRNAYQIEVEKATKEMIGLMLSYEDEWLKDLL